MDYSSEIKPVSSLIIVHLSNELDVMLTVEWLGRWQLDLKTIYCIL